MRFAGHMAWFLDRDGTLIVHKNYLCEPDQVELLPGVRETLEWAVSVGIRLFLFTNQSGIGRGYFTMGQVEACNARMLELLGPQVSFAGICIAPEAPDQPQVYRKPSPRYIHEMIASHGLDPAHTWMIGNSKSDVLAGVNARVGSVLVHPGDRLADVPKEVLHCRSFPELRSLPVGRPNDV